MKTLNKAFDIMELFLDTGEGLTIAEMANLSRLYKSTVCRMASRMTKRGYLKQQGKRVPILWVQNIWTSVGG